MAHFKRSGLILFAVLALSLLAGDGVTQAHFSGDSYAGAGLLKSTDGGSTWSHMGPERGMPNVAVYDSKINHGTRRLVAFTLTPAAPPFLGLILNGTSFRRGNVLILSARISPGSTPTTVDVYLAIQLPDGTLLFYPSFTTDLRPVVTNWTVVPFSGEIFRYTFSGAEPPGSYTWWAAFTEPGTLTVIGSMASAAFTFSP